MHYQKAVKKLILEYKLICDDGDNVRLTWPKSNVSSLHRSIKLHQPGILITPVCSYTKVRVYNISKNKSPTNMANKKKP